MIQIEAAIDAQGELAFESEDMIESRGKIIHEALSKYLFSGLLDMPWVKKFVEYKITNSETLAKVKSELEAAGTPWLNVKVLIPMKITFKNNGDRDTNLVKWRLEFVSHNGGIITYSVENPEPILLPANRVVQEGEKNSLTIPIPYVTLLFGEIASMMGLGGEDSKNFLQSVQHMQKDLGIYIDPKKAGKFIFEDQHGSIFTAPFEAAPILDLMEKARGVGNGNSK